MGLRELKKSKTRKAISDIATILFLERGYDNVTTAEIAQVAEVSVPTLFKYFPTKESLVFDEDLETEAKLLASLTERAKGVSIIDALLAHGLTGIDEVKKYDRKHFDRFMDLVEATPALSLYSRRMWMRHEQSLGATIRKESEKKLGKIEAESIAHFVLDAFHRSMLAPQEKATLRSLFEILRNGWE